MDRRYNRRKKLVDAVRKSRRLDKIQEMAETKFQRELKEFKRRYFSKEEKNEPSEQV